MTHADIAVLLTQSSVVGNMRGLPAHFTEMTVSVACTPAHI